MKEMVVAVGVEDFTIKYFRTCGEYMCDQRDGAVQIFGIVASKYINDEEKESSDAGFISEDINFVNKTIETLAKNTVTPMCLFQVLDDMAL